jgi:4-hydroxy-tetrahydrodipicolinate synthase
MSSGDTLDLGAIPRLLDFLAEAQVDAVMLGGTSGEGHALGIAALAELARAVVGRWREASGGRARLFLTVTAPSTALALERARSAGDGVDAIVLGPPYYFRYTEAELVAHYAAFEDLGLPVIAYDTPRYSGNPLTLEVRRAIAAMPHVVGMKDSAGDASLFRDTCDIPGHGGVRFEVAQGDERAMVVGLRAGAAGIVPGPANLAPKACVRLYRAVRDGALDEAERLQARIDVLSGIHAIRRGVATTKAAMALLGLAPATPSMPFQPLDASEVARVRAILVEIVDITGVLPA